MVGKKKLLLCLFFCLIAAVSYAEDTGSIDTIEQVITGDIRDLRDLADQLKVARQYANMAAEAEDVPLAYDDLRQVLEILLGQAPEILTDNEDSDEWGSQGSTAGMLGYIDDVLSGRGSRVSDTEIAVLESSKKWLEAAGLAARKGLEESALIDIRIQGQNAATFLLRADEGYDQDHDQSISDEESGITAVSRQHYSRNGY